MTSSPGSYRFHVVDYVIFILVIAASLSIGVYYAIFKQNKTTSQYLMAGRNLSIIPTAISLLVSYISAISILGNAAEIYYYGIDYMFVLVGYISAAFGAANLFVPLFYPLKLTSMNEVSGLLLSYLFIVLAVTK